MLHLEDCLKDIDKQIGFKEIRREQATNSCQYQLCDEITHEITILKTQCYQEQVELKSLQRKEQQSKWYKKRKETDGQNQSDKSTSTSFSSGHSSQLTKHTSQLLFRPLKRKHPANLSESSEDDEKEKELKALPDSDCADSTSVIKTHGVEDC